jgi:hypothetical protein
MKPVVKVVRFIVGILFIFSGLVKAIDPLGLSYKMDEFFDLWNEGLAKTSFSFLIQFLQFLRAHSLSLSVLMIAFEIIAGVALLIGWRMKIFSWLLLLLILFFTFLTGYAYFSHNPDGSPKFSNCGCFGDCIPLTVKTSFLKDIALTALIIFLFINRKKIMPAFSNKTNFVIMLLTTIFCFGLQWYVLAYLPIIDCLPYKKKNNIAEKMKSPPGSRPDSFAIRFVYEKGGKAYEFSPNDLPADLNTYSFKERKDKLIRKGNAEPPIKGFVLKTEAGDDSTQAVLSRPHCFLLFCENFEKPVSRWQEDFERLKGQADRKNIPVYIVTSSVNDARKALAQTPFWQVQTFECDYTAIRTAARTNPCLYLLKQGTVVNKWSYKRISAAIKEMPNR